MNLLTKAILGCTCVAGIAAYAPVARSADHEDAPATTADPTADINDVYAFSDPAASGNAVLGMTLFPAVNGAAAGTGVFSDAVQYVFHTLSSSAFGVAPAGAADIICTFAGTTAPQTYQCWVSNGAGGTADYVTGSTGVAAGTTSADGKLKVFAGEVGDPFFFNLAGFHATQATVEEANGSIDGGLPTNAFGCPLIDPGTAGLLREQLTTTPNPDGGTTPIAAVDFFAPFDTLAIVVSL